MEKSNLFEALAQYDYKAMIHLYAGEGMDSLRSMSNWIQIQQSSLSCSAEEKRDESINFHKNRLKNRNSTNKESMITTDTTTPPLFRAITDLQRIVHQTAKASSPPLQDAHLSSSSSANSNNSNNTNKHTKTNPKQFRNTLLVPAARNRPCASSRRDVTNNNNPTAAVASTASGQSANAVHNLPYLPFLAPPQSSTFSSSTRTSLSPPTLPNHTNMNHHNFQRKFRSCTSFRRHFDARRKSDLSTHNQSNSHHAMATLIDQGEVEDILYERAKSYTNSPPEASFSVHHRRGDDDFDSSREIRTNSSTDTNKTSSSGATTAQATLFDGTVAIGTPVSNNQVRGLGGGSGTIQHLACAIDSPFGLAIVLAMDADVSSRHTTFRRLIIHEAACCNSPDCLRLLLELGKGMNMMMAYEDDEDEDGEENDTSTFCNDGGCLGCQTPQMQVEDTHMHCLDSDVHPEKKQKSNCLSDLTSKSKSKRRITFLSLLHLAMELIGQMEEDKLTELEAARILLSKARINDINKEILSLICGVDSKQERAKKSSTGSSSSSQTSTYPQFISFLRETSSSLSNTDGHGNTALHWAAFKNSAPCIKLLFEYDADPNAVAESTGWRPLHDAAYSDSSDAIAILVEAGADVNSKAHSGATPLCFAAQEDSPNATRLLLESGADPTIRCENVPSQSDEEGNNNESQHHLLLQQTRFSGYTPLHYCAHYNSHKAAVVLLEHGVINKGKCLYDIKDLNNKVPIHIVAERGSSDVMREMLHNGVQVDCARSQAGDQASTAIMRSHDGVVQADGSLDDEENEVQDDGMEENANYMIDEAPPSPNRTHQNAIMNPISSPILRSLIPSEPRNSPKPWNCLTQNSIDECKLLLQEAECCWAPSRHYIFTPNDRASIFEVMKVAVRIDHIPHEMWLHVLKFCGRGWFDPPDYLVIEEE